MSDPNILPTHATADEAMTALEPVFTSGRPDIVTMPSGRTVAAGIGSDFIEIRYIICEAGGTILSLSLVLNHGKF